MIPDNLKKKNHPTSATYIWVDKSYRELHVLHIGPVNRQLNCKGIKHAEHHFSCTLRIFLYNHHKWTSLYFCKITFLFWIFMQVQIDVAELLSKIKKRKKPVKLFFARCCTFVTQENNKLLLQKY